MVVQTKTNTKLWDLLYSYQKEDVDILCQNPKMIVGHEMGTGKTEIALGVVEKTNPNKVLVVCPDGMVLEWQDRIKLRLGEGACVPYEKGYRLGAEHFSKRFLIINYEMLRIPPPKRRKVTRVPQNYINVLSLPKWDMVIFDEAHELKNPTTQRTKGCVKIARATERNYFLSGSIMLNYPNELWVFLNQANPEEYPSYEDFKKEFCIIKMTPWGPQVVKAKPNKLPELRERLAPYMIRREKRDVLKDLPPKSYRTIPVLMYPEQQRIYDTLKKELFVLLDSGVKITAPNALALLMKLRQVSLDPQLLGANVESPKTKMVLELCEDITKLGKQVVVFSWFASYLKKLHQLLPQAELITGEVKSLQQRREARLRIQNGQSQIMLMSIETAIGLDLTSPDICIFTDRCWVPKINEQAEDRLHRQGQKGNVLVIDLVCRDSIDEYMLEVHQRKNYAFNETIAIERTVERMRNS